MKPTPLLTAHTGCMGAADNSLLSIETACHSGVDIVEEDILITADGILVLSHDDNVHTMNGMEYRISQMTYEALSHLDIKAHHGSPGETSRILTLESVLPLIQASSKKMNLDIKSDACIEPLSRFVAKHGLMDQVFLSGCMTSRAHYVTSVNPFLRKLLNVDATLFINENYLETATMSCEDAKSANCFGLNLNYRIVKPELLQIAAKYELKVYIWTVDTEAEMRHFMEMGVHGITARQISELVRVKKELGK